MSAIKDRRGRAINVHGRTQVYVRAGRYAGRSAVVRGFFRGRDDFLGLAFFDARGELRNRDKPWQSPVDDLVRADHCEVVIA